MALRSLTWHLHPNSAYGVGPWIQLSSDLRLSPLSKQCCRDGCSWTWLMWSLNRWQFLSWPWMFLGLAWCWTVSDPALHSQAVLWIQLKLAAPCPALLTQVCWGCLAQAWHCWPCYSAWGLAPSPERSSRLLTKPHAEDAQLAKELLSIIVAFQVTALSGFAAFPGQICFRLCLFQDWLFLPSVCGEQQVSGEVWQSWCFMGWWHISESIRLLQLTQLLTYPLQPIQRPQAWGPFL